MFYDECLPRPSGLRFALLRDDLLQFCEGSRCAAMVTAYFANWHTYKMHEARKDQSMKNNGCYGDYVPDTALYQYQSIQEIAQGMLGEYARDSIIKAVQYLVEKDVLEEVQKANYKRGSSTVYLFKPQAIIDFIYNEYTPSRKIDSVPSRKIDTTINTQTEQKCCEEGKDSSSQDDANASSGTKLVRRQKKAPSIFGNDIVEDIFIHWNNLSDPVRSHKLDPETKVFKNAIIAITRALRKHTSDQIKQAMTNYCKLLNDRNTKMYYATQTKRWGLMVSLPEFFEFSPHSEEQMILHNETDIPESWYICCLQSYPEIVELFARYDKDDNPKITEKLEKYYASKIPGYVATVSTRNIFIRSAILVLQYHCKMKDKINWSSCKDEKTYPQLFAHWFIDACIDSANGNTDIISPEWLCGPKMLTERMPKYMRKMGMIASDITPMKSKQNTGDISLSSLLGEDY